MLVLWLMCLVTRSGFCSKPAAKTDPIISLAEILKRWQAVSLSDAVAAAEKGDLTAQHFLGYYHVEGLGGKVNREEGMRWYLRAADAGFPNSLNNLGVIYLNGNGVAKDEAKALDYFKSGRRAMESVAYCGWHRSKPARRQNKDGRVPGETGKRRAGW